MMPYKLGKLCEVCGIRMCYDGCMCEWPEPEEGEDVLVR